MEIKHRTELNKLMGKKQLVGAEIGVAQGLHSRDILTNWNIKKLYLVDNWATIEGQAGDAGTQQGWHDTNINNVKILIKPFVGKTKLLKGLSVDMAKQVANESLDFIYLDGDHSYEGVTADLKAWAPKVKKGGIIAGHDYLQAEYGVQKAVLEFAHGIIVEIIPEHKEEDAGFYFIKE